MYVKLSRPDMQYLKVFESELELALKKMPCGRSQTWQRAVTPAGLGFLALAQLWYEKKKVC